MSRLISLNARLAHDAIGTDAVEVFLCQISHPLLAEPVLLSADPTERITVEPLAYGTRSRWLAGDSMPRFFSFVLMSALVPDDKKDAPSAASLVIANLDSGISEVLQSVTDRATVDIALVLHTTPDLVEIEAIGLKLISAEGDGDQIILRFSRDPLTSEPWPAGRQTKSRFPGANP